MKRTHLSRAVRALPIPAVVGILSVTVLALTNPIQVAGDLNAPRGLADGPAGRLFYGEFDGSISELIAQGNNAGSKNLIGKVPATTVAAPQVATLGGQIFALTQEGNSANGAQTLYRVNKGNVRALANIGAYQLTDPDPYNLADPPGQSNPFGLAPLDDGSVLVSDAAGNDLLRVYPDGEIITVARLRPRTVPVPPGLPVGPPAGTMLPSEAVATSVAVGADGYYYVGELRGFPATPGMSQIWRIAPNSVAAVCDPAAPSTGACRRYADGFTSIVDLAAGADGSLYVVELSKKSWLQWLQGISGATIGSVFRLAPGGASRTELVPAQLTLPSGVAVMPDNSVYVTSPIAPTGGPGTIKRIQ
jgi:hypothetical protein